MGHSQECIDQKPESSMKHGKNHHPHQKQANCLQMHTTT
jgi:hypothetical protein